ncbi:hypothetical protein SRIMM317S_04649 [Streptomyces rimosus subsp. rimosus]
MTEVRKTNTNGRTKNSAAATATECTAIQCSSRLRRARDAAGPRSVVPVRAGALPALRVVVVMSVQSSAGSRPARLRISRVVTAMAITKSTSESTHAAPVLKFWKPSE